MGKVIAFSNQKGGSGKSTLSANLAVLWSNSGYKVAVIDADQQKSLTFWLSERKKYYGADDVGIDAYSFETRNLSEEIKKIKNGDLLFICALNQIDDVINFVFCNHLQK